MKALLIVISLISFAAATSCDMRSGTAKQEMEKFSGTPTPTITPLLTPTPVDPTEVVQVENTQDGERLTVNGLQQNKTVTCNKFDRVMINGSESTVTINGVCRQIMVNGDGNQITADAAAEIVLNGTSNSLKYSRFVNGKQPLISENQSGNLIEKIPFASRKSDPSRSKSEK